MKVLLIKTSSMGDLIHTMPAISDLQRAHPEFELHWLVEEAFSDIPSWHPFVSKVHTCAIRRWRKAIFSKTTWKEISALKHTLLEEHFDAVIDAQGLVKSAWMVRWFDCDRHGYNWDSVKEAIATRAYNKRYDVSRSLSAIERNRHLFSKAFNYVFDPTAVSFGLHVSKPDSLDLSLSKPYAFFLHGTNWESKVWPVEYWRQLAKGLKQLGMTSYISWGNEKEQERAAQIAEAKEAIILDRQSLQHLAYYLQEANVVVGSDTGLTHLAAALGAETFGIYGSTATELTGLIGSRAHNLQSSKSCSPCFKRNCPLVKGEQMIPCYESVGPDVLLDGISSLDR